MKRLFALFVTALLSLALVSACGKQSTPEPDTQPDTPKPVSVANGTTLAQLLSSEEFDALSAGIKNGSDYPSGMTLVTTSVEKGPVSDSGLILSTWYDLCALQVDSSAPVEDVTPGKEPITITFSWDDDRSSTFTFETGEYFSPDGETFYQLLSPEALTEVLDAIGGSLDKQTDTSGNDNGGIPFDGSSFSWDADGDGKDETFSVTFIDNGDEAPSIMEIKLNGSDAKGSVDGAYAIKELRSDADDNGPVLLINYEAGDYYNHDNDAFCTLRLINGNLVIGTVA